jgi:hypothetical protein
MTAAWALQPVCGTSFWWVIATSPEVLIFLFFMITDPRTIPAGNVARIAFGLLTGVASTLLLAPQTDEFGTKVGLLAGLVVISAARPILERALPEARAAGDDLRQFAGRLLPGGVARAVVRAGTAASAVLLLGVAIVAAGTPARGLVVPEMTEALNGVPHVVDPSTFPEITIERDVSDWDHTIDASGAQQILVTLAENLEVENQALLRADGSLLPAVDHGDRLAQMQERLREAEASGRVVVQHYRFDAVRLVLIVPFGVQTGISLGFESRGTLIEETYDADGALLDRSTAPFDLTFALRRATGSRWLNVAVLPRG